MSKLSSSPKGKKKENRKLLHAKAKSWTVVNEPSPLAKKLSFGPLFIKEQPIKGGEPGDSKK